MFPSSRLPRLSIRFALLLLMAAVGAIGAPESAGANSKPRILYRSPVPGARLVMPQTNIILGFERAPELSNAELASAVTLHGSVSGAHAGRTRLANEGRTLLFAPDREFAPGEQVTVELAPALLAGAADAARFSFTISATRLPAPAASIVSEWNDALVPPARASRELWAAPPAHREGTLPPDFPEISSTVYQQPAPGNLFLCSFGFSGPPTSYLLILDNDATPLWYRRMDNPCYDFKPQPNGRLTYFDGGAQKFFALNQSYAVVDSFACGNGYETDLHELLVLPNGHALLMSYDAQILDMSLVVPGGDPGAIVLGLIIQELDQNKQVIFQWRSWDHFEITDAIGVDLTASTVDYVHGNAIDVDTDGNLLISSRHLDEITKIDRTTGATIWRWGGRNNEFTFLDDTLGFSHQHAIRRLPNGHVSLYDNGTSHTPSFSRAVEYELDETAKTSRLVWQYRDTPDIYGFAMGYVQRLGGDHTLIGWGTGKPDVTEVDPNGQKVLEVHLPAGTYTYRAYRFPWILVGDSPPGHAPALASFSAFPNPVRGRAQLSLELPAAASVSLGVYDIGGREVLRVLDRVPYAAGSFRFAVDLSRQAPGLYFCKLTTDGHSQSRKLLLTR